jgi:hypothetical protein
VNLGDNIKMDFAFDSDLFVSPDKSAREERIRQTTTVSYEADVLSPAV